MRRCTAVERYKFIKLIEEHSPLDKYYKGLFKPGDIMTREEFARKLLRYGATLGRLAEEQCNGYQTWDRREDAKRARASELKEERIRAKVEELCGQFGCKAVFQGDPRGNVLKIQVPDGFTNDWGREGICVPTS